MMLLELLERKKDAIVRRWVEDALSVYPDESSAMFRRQKDPFANPVGNSLRVGTRGIFEAIIGGMDGQKIQQCLQEIVKIRAIQCFSASEALGFIFGLKEAIRAEIGQDLSGPELAPGLVEIDRQIDRIALAAFDVFVQCREQVHELRVNEVKRSVSWVVDKLNQRGCDWESEPMNSDEGVSR